jgi:hypothetical protein
MKHLAILMTITLFSLNSFANVDEYRKIAKDTIKLVLMKKITPDNVDDVIKNQEKLMEIGKIACTKYKSESKDPTALKVMDLVVTNADAMKEMSLREIEKQWHNGNFLSSNGVDPKKVKHFGSTNSYMDMIVHPATAILVLKEYKKSKNSAGLSQIKDELSEVLEHIKHLNA